MERVIPGMSRIGSGTVRRMTIRPTSEQRAWLNEVLGSHRFVEDLSWPGTPSGVWLVEGGAGQGPAGSGGEGAGGSRCGSSRSEPIRAGYEVVRTDSESENMRSRYVVKAAWGPMRHHVEREVDAHESVAPSLAETGDAQAFIAASRELGIIVLGHVPGVLVEGTAVEHEVETHRRAGALLARIHRRGSRVDEEYEATQTRRARAWLSSDHRIGPDRVVRITDLFDHHEPRPVTVVPTHGDWHARNWVIENPPGRVRIIDFGRFAWRPAHTDLFRCWAGSWRDRPDLEAAHLDGYGEDPRDDTWSMECLRQAVSTAAWARQMGDEAFEQEGLDMIDRVLARFGDG